MNWIITFLVAFPLGLLVSSRLVAQVTYIALFLFAYSSMTDLIIIDWAGGNPMVFGPFPKASGADMWSYVAMNAFGFALGALLVHLGSVVRLRRQAKAKSKPATATPSMSA